MSAPSRSPAPINAAGGLAWSAAQRSGDGSVLSFTADGSYDKDGVYREITARHPEFVEADIGRLKRVIREGLQSRIERRRATAVAVAVAVEALNRMFESGRTDYVRIV